MIAIYTGSFSPITLGHLNIIERGAKLFPTLIVGVYKDVKKQGALPFELRLKMLQVSTAHLENVQVKLFSGLACDFAKEQNANTFLRGARDAFDYAYEADLASTNASLSGIETLFLHATPEYAYMRSSWIRDIAKAAPEKLSSFIPKEAFQLYLNYLKTSSPSQ